MAEVDANDAYQRLIVNAGNAIGLDSKGKANYSGLKARVQDTLAGRSAQQQFEFDTALWYGYLVKKGITPWKRQMLKRLFRILSMGGLMVNRGRMVSPTTILNNWIPWSSQNIPICSCISHTARVLICLPDQSDTVWNWLWGNQTPQGRMAATHGVEPAGNTNAPGPNINRQGPSVRKPVKEVKGNHNVKHYGVNIALGGVNNINPVSGKGIRENGKHGHLYLAYYKGGPRYAILVGTEQSAPIDRQEAQKGTFGKVKSVFRAFNVPDQYGGGHGFGGHSRFSATGGDDFSYISGHGRAPTQLEDYGPGWGHYIDGMYVDLTNARFNQLRNKQFAPEKVGEKGNPPG